jgi:hypothetical protein
MARPVSAESYRDDKLRQLSGELRRSREVLYRAHRGLARKAAQSSALEEFLKNEIEIPEEVASEHKDLLPNTNAARKLSDVISKIRYPEKRLVAQDGKAPAKPKREKKDLAKGKRKTEPKKTPDRKKQQKVAAKATLKKVSPEMLKDKELEEKPACAMILLQYHADSTFNLEVRERALEFVTDVLKRSPYAVS